MIYKFQEYKKSTLLRNHLNIGGTNPGGERIDITSLYIERSGKPCIDVMGEYHFSRDSRKNWYKTLCEMKAGGISVAATYIFWIYHEETEGEFDFSGDLDLKQFILEAKKAGLDVVIRIGPWAHGECRNGGLPDWILKKPYNVRENNPEYLAKARIWYEKIYEQVKDLFYKDGGNIIGIQIENELVDDAPHLAKLKEIAVDIGFDAPIWTVTGWNSHYGAEIPIDEFLPVFGAYPDAPWENTTDKLPLSPHYAFNTMRNDSAIGVDLIDDSNEKGWQLPYERYPFATCELGGGNHPTHHRRPYIKPMDIYALSLCKLGSGNNLIGYYMYKGGTNKIGKLSTFNETKATGYPNDYTALSYDFQAPISEYGEIRGHYRLLNMLHMFVADFGDVLAPMETVMAQSPVKETDLKNLRYAMRTDGTGGFVFINNYQRLAELEHIKGAVIDTGSVLFPEIDIKSGLSFVMPFNIRLGDNILEYATSQLLCKVGNTYVFTEIDGIAPRYKFKNSIEFSTESGKDNILRVGGISLITLTKDEALYTRKINGELYIGETADLYYDTGIRSADENSFKYFKWNGASFDEYEKESDFVQSEVRITDSKKQFEPVYTYELEIGGQRSLIWKKLEATTRYGFVDIPLEYDAAQIYADGKLVADNFYIGVPWRVAAELIYGKECYIVMSELKNDFYREI